MTFEESIKELETIVNKLESNEIPLDDAISAFEESQKLIKSCEKQLSVAEKKMKKLIKTSQSTDDEKESDFQLELI